MVPVQIVESLLVREEVNHRFVILPQVPDINNSVLPARGKEVLLVRVELDALELVVGSSDLFEGFHAVGERNVPQLNLSPRPRYKDVGLEGVPAQRGHICLLINLSPKS